ncbi:MAG: elongation factor 4 [Candidatus Woykebacteria bacterium GWB1_45_5]|uniref:Elongation factor 4 n=2 Tax=Candidatus Woykeibacteriota TaxID=1817899 RepID=A0A1G1W0T9_9BACT|nr:MAG: elongation factor 4 [Candidatus Woykebacteria bacterium GWA1_44_8]OGY23684.1 MAG: elongation factor 4 [Candidatus Woykebacteria bacterium GWB1_45_5]
MENIRNFSIIAHIDHGKSTLADRFLEVTGTIPKEKLTEQYLDQMELERERGITIKLAPVTMKFRIGGKDIHKSELYILNLIDTPGHVDFSYEVSRSLSCVEGTLLLVDATRGVEAQTLSNFLLAKEQNLKIIPVINKIDLPNAQIKDVLDQLTGSFGFAESEIYKVSAKTGEGVKELLNDLVRKIPVPKGDLEKPLKALVFDSSYDSFKGVIAYVRVFEGEVRKGMKIKFLGTKQEAETGSVGYFSPELLGKESLQAGEIGWVASGLKEVQEVQVGDTIIKLDQEKFGVQPLPGYKEFKPMVFAGIFPVERDDFPRLKEALEKLKLNDASLTFEPENSPALGFGFRAGFLGLLHMEVVQERLEREFGLNLILSAPTVRYRVIKTDSERIEVSNPQVLPSPTEIKEIQEPWVTGRIVSLEKYFGPISQLLYEHRAVVKNSEYFGDKIKISCKLPLAEIVSQFYDQLKTVSSGFASFDYDLAEFRRIEAVKLEILVAKQSVDALSQIVPKEKSFRTGKALVEKLKEVIPRQQFEVYLQAAVGGKIVAAEKIPAYRKDVTAKLYGGDRTRKDKLLSKQKVGKKRMKRIGKVDIPQEAFLSVLKI